MDKARGERIVNLMREKGFTRDQFALRSGYSISTISKIRNGYDFTTDIQDALCVLLDTTPDFINGYKSTTPQIEHISSSLARINNEALTNLVIDLIKLHDSNKTE